MASRLAGDPCALGGPRKPTCVSLRVAMNDPYLAGCLGGLRCFKRVLTKKVPDEVGVGEQCLTPGDPRCWVLGLKIHHSTLPKAEGRQLSGIGHVELVASQSHMLK